MKSVIWDNRISSINDLIILLIRSISPNHQSAILLARKQKRLGWIQGQTRNREWQELLHAAKHPMIQMEYAKFSPAEPPSLKGLCCKGLPNKAPMKYHIASSAIIPLL